MEKTDSSPLSRQALYANKKQWNQFLSVFYWQWALVLQWQALSSFCLQLG